MVTLEAKAQSFARGKLHIVERGLYIGNGNHLQCIIRRSQQVEINGIPDGGFNYFLDCFGSDDGTEDRSGGE